MDDNHLLAWCVRNLYELHLTLVYVLQSEQNLLEWLGQFPHDEKEIIEGFQTIRIEGADSAKQRLDARVKAILNTSKKTGLDLHPAWRTADLAKKAGKEEEHKILFKFLSKYVHPSSWIVNASPTRTNSDDYRNFLACQVQVFSDQIYRCILEEYKIDPEKIKNNGRVLWPWTASSHEMFAIADLYRLHAMLNKETDEYLLSLEHRPNLDVTAADVEGVEKFAMWRYVLQRFDQPSRPQGLIKAARLFGAASTLRRLVLGEEAECDEVVNLIMDKVRADLGENTFQKEYQEGEQMTLSQALNFAVD